MIDELDSWGNQPDQMGDGSDVTRSIIVELHSSDMQRD